MDRSRAIHATILGIDLIFETRPTLFSPKRADAGTLALLSYVEFTPADMVLDLGCGYGLMGIYAAKFVPPSRVHLLDNDAVAIECATNNVRINDVDGVTLTRSDGFRDFNEVGFTKILCNPPYHADFAIAKHFIHKGFNRLAIDGTMWIVTKRQAWYRNKLESTFGRVRVHTVGSYFVFEATKRSATYASVAATMRASKENRE